MYNTKSKEMLYNFFIINKEKSYSANDLVNEFSSEIDKSTIYRQLIKLENKNMLRKTFNSNKNIYKSFIEEQNIDKNYAVIIGDNFWDDILPGILLGVNVIWCNKYNSKIKKQAISILKLFFRNIKE